MTRSTDPNLLTIAELARNLDLPESTTRYYCNRFAAHLPFVGEGRRRRYKPEAFEKLRTIAQTMRRDKNAYAVDLALRNEEGGARTPVSPQALATSAQFAEEMLSLMGNQTRALQDIAAAIGIFADRLSIAAPVAMDGAADLPTVVNTESTDVLKQEIASLREQIRSSESVHQNDLEQLRKWLTRLGEAVVNK